MPKTSLTGEEAAVLGLLAQAKPGAVSESQKAELMQGLSKRAQKIAAALMQPDDEVPASARKTANALVNWAENIASSRKLAG